MKVRQLQQNILDAYDRNFSKHAPITDAGLIYKINRSKN